MKLCRRDFSPAMPQAGLKSRLLIFLLAIPAFAAVDGTVINKTTGKAQPGATVTLYKLGQAGMESVESVKSDANGRYTINQDLQGPRLIQTAFDGVTYNHMLPPGAPTSGVTLEVYNSSKKPGAAHVAQHMILFEPGASQMVISESYIYLNDGVTTYNDPDGGTLKFWMPEAAKGIVQVNATAPQGMPIQRAAEKTAKANIYKIDFPIKPGETRIDLTYLVPFKPGSSYEGYLVEKGPTRIVTPKGVTVTGDGTASLGAEPRTGANIYDLKRTEYSITIQGAGALRGGGDQQAQDTGGGASDSGDSGPQVEEIMPKVFASIQGNAGLLEKVNSVKWILLITIAILTLGFVLLFRQQAPAAAAKGKNERRQR